MHHIECMQLSAPIRMHTFAFVLHVAACMCEDVEMHAGVSNATSLRSVRHMNNRRRRRTRSRKAEDRKGEKTHISRHCLMRSMHRLCSEVLAHYDGNTCTAEVILTFKRSFCAWKCFYLQLAGAGLSVADCALKQRLQQANTTPVFESKVTQTTRHAAKFQL